MQYPRLIGVLGLSFLAGVPAAAVECVPALPEEAKQVLSQQWSGWSIVTLGDLVPEDQVIWMKNHVDRCPGVIDGNFMGKRATHFAVTLLRRDGSRLEQNLLLLAPSATSYVAMVLRTPAETAVPSVLRKVPAGRYPDAERTRIVRTRFDAIVLGKLEGAATMYYWSGGTFRLLQIAQ